MRSSIWIGILIGSTIGEMIPWLWGDSMLSYSSVIWRFFGVVGRLQNRDLKAKITEIWRALT
jgi:hypothetical protein